jgi:hypothetical protein
MEDLEVLELKCPICGGFHYVEKSLWEEILKYDEKGDQCDDCVAKEYAD